MAKKKNTTDLFSSLRTQGIRKRVARALSDLDSGAGDTREKAEKLAQRVVSDLRSAADALERRLNIGGAGTRSAAAKKGAATRKRTATKRTSAAKKSTSTRARKTTSARKTTARKTTPRKTTKKS
jgi:DNA-binding protein HU-beta